MSLQQWQCAKRQAGEQRCRKSKSQHAAIDGQSAQRHHVVRQKPRQQRKDSSRERQTNGRAQKGEHKIFRPKLAQHDPSGRAQGEPGRDLRRPAADAHQNQSRQVGAGNKQNKADRQHQSDHRLAHAVIQIAVQQRGVEPRPSLGPARNLVEERLAQVPELRRDLLPSRARREAQDDLAIISAALSTLVRLQRREDVGSSRRLRAARQHAQTALHHAHMRVEHQEFDTRIHEIRNEGDVACKPIKLGNQERRLALPGRVQRLR